MSWFTVGGNAGIALGPAIVTPVLLVTRLRGNAAAARAGRGRGRRAGRTASVARSRGHGARGLAVSVGGLATPLFGNLADSGGLTTALAAIAAVPAIACALSFLVRDPRPAR